MKKLCMLVLLLAGTILAHAQPADGSYSLLLDKSLISWKVDYSIGTKGHEGTLKLASGTMQIKNGIIQGGNFVIDMASVYVTDMPQDDGGKSLADHLRADDFLATKTHPKGHFTVLSGEKNSVSGYLILKGISNTITFPVTITDSNSGLLIKGEFPVNRTLWGINYQSGILGAIKDEAISDNVFIVLNLSFEKAQ